MGLHEEIDTKRFFLVGIQGTGMASLALLLKRFGASVTGSDSPETFSTSTMLKEAQIHYFSVSDPSILPDDTSILIHSAAYEREKHPQIRRAIELGLPVYSYPEWVAYMSRHMRSYGVAGTHGKTTASGCLEWVLRHTDLPYCALYGSHIQGFSPGSLSTGCTWGVFEACEYRDHFLLYELEGLLITTMEHDHPDWFATVDSVFDSFWNLVQRLPAHAPVVCATDTPLTLRLIEHIHRYRPELTLMTYGEHPSSLVRLTDYLPDAFESSYSLSTQSGPFFSKLGSIPLILDTVGAALLGASMVLSMFDRTVAHSAGAVAESGVFGALMHETEQFPGTAKRLEVLFTEDDIVYVDDYAHHPTEITVALSSLRMRYPDRRIVSLFHPHTVSRSETFYDEFVASLRSFDALIVCPVFVSARSDGDAQQSYELSRRLAHDAQGLFVANEHEVVEVACTLLRSGDLCVTMGAGNTSGLAERIVEGRRSNTW